MLERKKQQMASLTQEFTKADLLTLFMSALRTESYRYAEILRHEIKSRYFSEKELQTIRNSDCYFQLNGLFETQGK